MDDHSGKWMAPWLDLGFHTVLDLSGDELAQPIEVFQPLYRAAKSKGMRLKAHVGEWGTADDVWRAVEVLELDEVQHGIAAADSTAVMRFLADHQITLNICPTSNILLGRVARARLRFTGVRQVCACKSAAPARLGRLSATDRSRHAGPCIAQSQLVTWMRYNLSLWFAQDLSSALCRTYFHRRAASWPTSWRRLTPGGAGAVTWLNGLTSPFHSSWARPAQVRRSSG
jgi:hypothetical protein